MKLSDDVHFGEKDGIISVSFAAPKVDDPVLPLLERATWSQVSNGRQAYIQRRLSEIAEALTHPQ